jgi:hypothetical protein
MKPSQRLIVHLALLAAASLGAVYVWTRDKNAKASIVADVRVWGGKADDVKKIEFDSKLRKIVLESHTDAAGRWFEGTVEKKPPEPKPAGDGGVEPAPEGTPTIVQIVSVKAAEKIAEGVAPLRAVRELGKIGGDQASDFGLAEPEGTLTLQIGANTRKLAIGATAPGGTDRYVKDLSTELVYAIPGEFLRDLLSGEAVLNERDLHGFEDDEIKTVRISASGKSREIARSGVGGSATWSDASTPDKPDETAATWMSKVGRLRPAEYVAALPGSPDQGLFLRIDYVGKKNNLGFLEVFRFPTADEKKADWYLRTERTRKFAKVYASMAEQLESDLGSVLR